MGQSSLYVPLAQICRLDLSRQLGRLALSFLLSPLPLYCQWNRFGPFGPLGPSNLSSPLNLYFRSGLYHRLDLSALSFPLDPLGQLGRLVLLGLLDPLGLLRRLHRYCR